jgi:ABC-type transport system involved in multi-copper enzyme maturation permease subunit
MLRDIIKKEILDSITSPKFVITFILCTILILLSAYIGITNYIAEKREYEANVALNRRILEGTTDYLGIRSAMTIYRPPQALETIVVGIEQAAGRATPLGNTLDDSTPLESKYESNPVFAIFGALDLMFIVKIVLSLVAILFTYDAIVGEKEKGTLKLALANNVPRDRLILGKAIGSYISLLVPLLVPLILCLTLLMLVPDMALGGSDWIRILLILGLFIIYLSVFFSLGLFVSARALRSSTSFLVLLLIWIVIVVIIPNISVVAASQAKPIPSIHEITTKKREFGNQAYNEFRRRMDEWVKSPEANDKDFRKKFLEFRDAETRMIQENSNSVDRDYQLRKKAQQNLAVNLSRISPASALTFGSMSIARTGVDEYERFIASVRDYRTDFERWYNSNAYSFNRSKGAAPGVNLRSLPRYSISREALRDSLFRALPDFGLMLTMIVVFFVGAYVSFLRYDVR